MGKRSSWLACILGGAAVPLGICLYLAETMRKDGTAQGTMVPIIPYAVGLWGMCLLVPLTPWPVGVPREAEGEDAKHARWMSRVFRALWYAVGAGLAAHFGVTVRSANVPALVVFGAYAALGLPVAGRLWGAILKRVGPTGDE